MLYGYSRISTAGQKETSLEVQDRFHKQLAESLNQEFTSVREIGSGKDTNRPELQRLLTKVKENDCVSFYDNSRLGRNTEENIKIAKVFNAKGVKVYVTGREFKIDQATDELTFALESAISTYQRKLQNSKAKASIDLQRSNGNFVFGRLYGYDQYKSRGKHYAVVNQEEAVKIKLAYEKFLAGEQIYNIAKELDIYVSTLIVILNNPIYCGYYLDSVDLTKIRQHLSDEELKQHFIKSNVYPPIIDEETFFKFRSLYRGKHKVKKYTFRGSRHELTGVYKCTCCQSGFVFITSRMNIGGKDYEYTYYENSFPRCSCKKHKKARFRSDDLEKITAIFLILALKAGIEVAGFFAETKNALLENTQDLVEKNDALKQEIEAKNSKIARIKALILDGTIEPEDFKKDMQELKTQISDLEKSIEENNRIISYKNRMIEDVLEEEAKDSLDVFLNSEEEGKRDFYKRFVEKAYIYSKDKLEIEFINTKKFVYEKGSFVMSYLGQEQVRGKIADKLSFDLVGAEDEHISKYLNDYYEKLAEEVNEILEV